MYEIASYTPATEYDSILDPNNGVNALSVIYRTYTYLLFNDRVWSHLMTSFATPEALAKKYRIHGDYIVTFGNKTEGAAIWTIFRDEPMIRFIRDFVNREYGR